MFEQVTPTNLHIGEDDVVRAVVLRTSKNCNKNPIQFLYPPPMTL